MLPTKFRFIWPCGFRGEDFRNRPIRNKNRMWGPCLLMELERNEYSLQRTAHRCFLPSFRSFGQEVSEEKNFFNLPIRNKNRLWRPCLLTDQDEISNLYRGPSIDASYQVLVHLAKRFQRRRFLKPEALKSLYRSPGNKKNQLCPASSWNYDQHKKHKVCKGPSND